MRPVKGLNICRPNFQSFSSADLERLQDNKEWLTDSHVTLALLFVPIFFSVLNLMKFPFFPGTVFENTGSEIFGRSSRSRSWTPVSGPRCRMTQMDTTSGTWRRWISWAMTSSWCLCLCPLGRYRYYFEAFLSPISRSAVIGNLGSSRSQVSCWRGTRKNICKNQCLRD